MRNLSHIITLILLISIGGSAFGQLTESGSTYPSNGDISKSITIYPNPATDFISIKLGTLKSNHAKLTLHNIIGNEITIETEVVDEHEVRVRVKDIPTGYYLLAVRDDQSQFRGTYKFLKR